MATLGKINFAIKATKERRKPQPLPLEDFTEPSDYDALRAARGTLTGIVVSIVIWCVIVATLMFYFGIKF